MGQDIIKTITDKASEDALIDWETNMFISVESPQALEIILIRVEDISELTNN